MRTMFSRHRALLTLLALTTFLPELFTGSTPIVAFLNPVTIFFFGFGYGLAVLLIRELAVRYHIGLAGQFCFGLAYGLLNEGLFAKTLITQRGVPVPQYDHYGVVFGFSVPWTFFISCWHAFAAVVYPIALTHWFFPEASRKPWLRGATVVLLGSALMLFATAAFLRPSPPRGLVGTPGQLVVLLTAMLLLFLLGFVWNRSSLPAQAAPPGKTVWLGFSIVVPFLLLAACASAKVDPLLFGLAFAGIFAGYLRLLRRQKGLASPGFLYFGIGWYGQNIALSLLVLTLLNPLLAAVTAITDILILRLLWQQIRKRASRECADAPA